MSQPDPSLAALWLRDTEQTEDRRRLRLTLAVAAVFHLLLFFIHLPALAPAFEVEAEEPQRVYVVRPLPRLKIEQPIPTEIQPHPERPTIPVPEFLMPEIVRRPEAPRPDLRFELPTTTGFEIPGPPPVVIHAGEPPPVGPIQVSGEVVGPQAVFAPKPQYTEHARQIRLQGTVVLQAVIDEQGKVTDLEVLKPMPLGLTEAALTAAKQWRFTPATLHDQPVPVFWRLSVTFRLQ